MKKKILKAKPYIACTVALLILILSFSSSLFFYTSAELSTQSKEILSGKLPIAYYSADEGSFTDNENEIKYGSKHISEAEVGFDVDNLNTKAFWDTYTANFTDSDDKTGTLLQPGTSGDRVVLIYKFSSHTVNKVGLSFSGNKKRNFSIYLSEDKKTLFSGTSAYTSPNNRDKVFSIDVADISSSYIGIVFESPNYELLDLKLYGIKNEVQITGDNVLKNLTPYMYASANEDGFTYNWNMTHYGPSDAEKMYGYSDPSATNKTTWDQYTQTLTDDDAQKGLYIKNENINNCKRVIAIYELDKFYDISALKITAENKSKRFSIYVGQSASSLFDALPLFTFNNNLDEIIIEACNNKKIKYIGFVFDTPAYTVYEIEAYGTEYVAPLISDSLIRDKTPTRYITAANGSFAWTWHQQYYGNGAAERIYGYNESYPERKTSWGDSNPQGWDKYTKAITDGDTGTSMILRPEFASESLILVYNIDDYIISGLNIEASASSKAFAVYASKNIGSLFTEKPIYEVKGSTETTYDVIELDKRASYIGIVFEKPNLELFEFSVFGTKYQRPNYGTDLTDNGELIGIYTTERGYPAVPNGYNFIDTVSPSATYLNLLDNNFNTTMKWTPWYCKEKPLPTDPYNVVVIDLKYKSTVDKILIDSTIGGLDIFVSDTQVGIFDDINRRVYSSGGDNLTEDGKAFDAAYDMPTGENLIDVEDVECRFVGFVVTRSAKVGTSNWGMVSINEIQIFGTAQEQDYGENILLGKTPIMTYRAKHGEYDVSQGTYESNQSNALFTDGDDSKQTYYQFPNNGGKASYGYGALVMIYYLDGTVDINHIAVSAGNNNYYYNIGGITMYASALFKDLFNEENCFYDTYGYRNNEEMYDPAYDISCKKVNTYHDEEVTGRYLAIVHTRPHPSKVSGWGMVRLSEIEVYGNIIAPESLPDTEIKDPKTGATLNFAFENPDKKFDFVKLGIKSFALEEVKSALTDEVYMALSNYNYRNESNPFEIVFYDSAGKVFDKSKLKGMTADINIPQKNEKYCYLGEIYNDMVYPCDRAARMNDNILISKLDNLDKIFIYLSEGQPTKLVSPVFEKTSQNGDGWDEWQMGDDQTYDYDMYEDSSEYSDENGESDVGTKKKVSTGGKKWVQVNVDDPYEWFWNIFDTFAQNIWMFVLCLLSLFVSIVLVVLNIIYHKKKRGNVL